MTRTDISRNPSQTTLRQFAGLWLLILGGLGCWHLLRGNAASGRLLLALAGVGIPGLIRPGLLRPLFVGWMIVVFPAGWLISRLILAVLFLGVFVPLGMWFRLHGRDVLRCRRRSQHTHWQPKPAAPGAASYYRQF